MTQDTREQSAETEAAREFAALRWNDDADHELQAMCYCLRQTGTANGLVEDRPYAEVEWWQNKADDLFDSIDRRLGHPDALREKVMAAIDEWYGTYEPDERDDLKAAIATIWEADHAE